MPIFMYERNEPVHKLRHIIEMWGYVISYVYRLFAESSAKLGYANNCSMVQRPEHVLVN